MFPSRGALPASSSVRSLPASCASSSLASSVKKRIRPSKDTAAAGLGIAFLSTTSNAPGHLMRIAIVTTSWPETEEDPAGHFVRTSARDLQREGHDVEVVSPQPGGAFGWPGTAARLSER